MLKRKRHGFTLIEMIVVISLIGIIAVIAGQNISRPVESFIDLSRRANLVDSADLILTRITREVRLALPNSVRLTNGGGSVPACTASGGSRCALEFLRTLDGGRYREELDTTAPLTTNFLDFTLATDSFDVLANLNNLTQIDSSGGASSEADCINGTTDCLVIYNLGQTGANAYSGDNIAAIRATAPFEFIRATPFPFQSPQQRFHIVDTPVTFLCNSATQQINRIESYAIQAAQSLVPAGTTSLLSNDVERCEFHYAQGNSTRNAVLSIQITVSENNQSGASERVSLIQQVRIPNIP